MILYGKGVIPVFSFLVVKPLLFLRPQPVSTLYPGLLRGQSGRLWPTVTVGEWKGFGFDIYKTRLYWGRNSSANPLGNPKDLYKFCPFFGVLIGEYRSYYYDLVQKSSTSTETEMTIWKTMFWSLLHCRSETLPEILRVNGHTYWNTSGSVQCTPTGQLSKNWQLSRFVTIREWNSDLDGSAVGTRENLVNETVDGTILL